MGSRSKGPLGVIVLLQKHKNIIVFLVITLRVFVRSPRSCTRSVAPYGPNVSANMMFGVPLVLIVLLHSTIRFIYSRRWIKT